MPKNEINYYLCNPLIITFAIKKAIDCYFYGDQAGNDGGAAGGMRPNHSLGALSEVVSSVNQLSAISAGTCYLLLSDLSRSGLISYQPGLWESSYGVHGSSVHVWTGWGRSRVSSEHFKSSRPEGVSTPAPVNCPRGGVLRVLRAPAHALSLTHTHTLSLSRSLSLSLFLSLSPSLSRARAHVRQQSCPERPPKHVAIIPQMK